MIIEKTVTDGNQYNINKDDYVAEGELTVTITLCEYRELIKGSAEARVMKERDRWVEEYRRANNAENRVKELEDEVNALYKRLGEATMEGEQE